MPRRTAYRLTWNIQAQVYELDGPNSPAPFVYESDTDLPWLHALSSFAFSSRHGDACTLRKETVQRGTSYWYAYRRQKQKMFKRYAGRSTHLTLAHLETIAAVLNTQDDPVLPAPEKRIRHEHSLPTQRHLRPYLDEVLAQSPDQYPSGPLVQALDPSFHRPLVLLQSKFAPPPAPQYLISRPHVLRVLQEAAVKPLTLVCAPAGFGKTTLVGEWAAQSGRVCAWLFLDRIDNDPARWLSYLLGALQQSHPALGRGRFSSSPFVFDEFIAVIFDELSALSVDMTLIVENYQVIENQLIHDMLSFLLAHLPPHLHVLLVSRSEPPLPLARLRVSGQLTEINANVLRFTSADIETLLLSRLKLNLGSAEVVALSERTEGWIAGVHLARAALQGQSDLADRVADFAGSHPYVVAYVREEILADQPEALQTFLLQTASLVRFNASLCTVVTSQADAELLLAQLERANLFLGPCEQQIGWYRYHPLVAEALSQHLQQNQPDQPAMLLLRASQWFEAHGSMDEAIAYALKAEEMIRAATLIERMVQELLARGEILTLRRWLGALPDSVIRARPRLCIAMVWLVFITSQAEPFLFWIEAAERACQETCSTDSELLGEIVGLRAMHRVACSDFAETLTTCHQALQGLPPGNLYPRGLLLLLLGLAYGRNSSVGAGMQALAEARHCFQTLGHVLLLPYVTVIQAELYFAQGSPSQAAKLCQQVLTLATGQHVSAVLSAGLAHMGLGYVFWEWNNLAEARKHLLQAWDCAVHTQTEKTLMSTAGLLIQVTHAQGDGPATEFWLQQLEALCYKTGSVSRWEFLATSRARKHLADGDVEDALCLVREQRVSLEDRGSTPDQMESVIFARVLISAGRASADTSYAQQALLLLKCLLVVAEAAGRVRDLLEILVLQTLALHLSGERTGALDVLARAVSLAESGRYIRLFVDEGHLMATLLRHLFEYQRTQKAPSTSLTYLSNLVKAFNHMGIASASSDTGEPLLDPLSRREHEVLWLLAAGHKNREIADELVIVTGTVKAHINTIYQKLGVSSRVQAVVRARTLGLL